MTAAPTSPRTRQRPRPTGIERPFADHELFWSTTDRKGIITSGNDVFARVAAYELDEMRGQPHNLIRHPDMPRGAFRLLWDYLDAGRPVAAYVKNLAADGGHYWVLAYVAPTPDGGFLSIRLKPGTAYFDAARTIYERARAFELEHEHDIARRKDVILASRDLLAQLVQDSGFADYDQFMQTALAAEVQRRAAHVGATARRDHAGSVGAAARTDLEHVAASIADWSGATDTLRAQARTMVQVADDIELFSLNAQIASTRLGADGRALLAVAGLLTRQATELRPRIESQVARIDSASGMLDGSGDIAFATAVACLQLDLLLDALEPGDDDRAEHLDAASRQLLAGAYERGVHALTEVFDSLHDTLARIDLDSALVRTGMDRLRALEVNGRIESTRIDDAQELGRMFTDIGDHVRAATAALAAADTAALVDSDALHRVERSAAALTRSLAT